MNIDEVLSIISKLDIKNKKHHELIYNLSAEVVDEYCSDDCEECPIGYLCDIIEKLDNDGSFSYAS